MPTNEGLVIVTTDTHQGAPQPLSVSLFHSLKLHISSIISHLISFVMFLGRAQNIFGSLFDRAKGSAQASFSGPAC